MLRTHKNNQNNLHAKIFASLINNLQNHQNKLFPNIQLGFFDLLNFKLTERIKV